ncbi:hypothetical protein ACVIDN_006336 [Rhizobium brockwellii]
MMTYAYVHPSTNVGGGLSYRIRCRSYAGDCDCFHAFRVRRKVSCNDEVYSATYIVTLKTTLDLSFNFRLTIEVVRYLAYISYCNVPRIVVFDSYFRVS